jgi:hypothetical protein
MKLKYGTIASIILTLWLFSWLFVTAVNPYIPSVFVVQIPKAYNPNFTDEEFLEYFQEGNAISISELERRNLPIIANCGILYILLSSKGNIKINFQDIANMEYITPLTEKLNEVFCERENNSVFEPNSNKIVKTVIVKAPLSAKYGEVAKLIDAVKSSGADPIILQIDDLPE